MTNEEALKMTLEQCEYFKQRYISRKGVGCDNNDGCKDCYANFVIKSLEKQIAKKPMYHWDGNENQIICPSCKEYPFDITESVSARTYCGICGQRIDWSDESIPIEYFENGGI